MNGEHQPSPQRDIFGQEDYTLNGEQPLSDVSNERMLRRSSCHVLEHKYASPSSIAVIGLITFVGDSARGLIYPALWPLCESLGGNKVDLGWLVATFSIGRLVISSYIGKFADIYRHKVALIISNVLLVFGAILWANSARMGSHGIVALYCAQFIMGLGTGNIVACCSYLS